MPEKSSEAALPPRELETQLSLGEIVWEGLYRDADRPFVGLMVSDWSAARSWQNVPTGDYL